MDTKSLAKEWLDREVKHPENTTLALAQFLDRIRAEARAEALRDAYEEIRQACETAIEVGDNPRFINGLYKALQLVPSAAIIADEPKEREAEEWVDWVALKKIAEEQFDLRAKNAIDCKARAIESGDMGELECYSCELQILSRGYDSWIMAYHIMRHAEVERKIKEDEHGR